MLVAIIFLYQEFGTTSIARLLDYSLPFYIQVWLWIAFFASFAVKSSNVAISYMASRCSC